MAIREWREAWRRLSGRGAYPPKFAFLLLSPVRSFILSRRELVFRLHLTVNSRVLELGPGPGFFSARVAGAVPSGHLYLVDLQREMLEKARWRVRLADFGNVSFTQASGMDLPFASGAFDVAFLVAVLGEVPDPGACLESIWFALRPQGVPSVTELPGDPDALTESNLAALLSTRGFEHIESLPVRGRGFTSNFRKLLAPG